MHIESLNMRATTYEPVQYTQHRRDLSDVIFSLAFVLLLLPFYSTSLMTLSTRTRLAWQSEFSVGCTRTPDSTLCVSLVIALPSVIQCLITCIGYLYSAATRFMRLFRNSWFLLECGFRFTAIRIRMKMKQKIRKTTSRRQLFLVEVRGRKGKH